MQRDLTSSRSPDKFGLSGLLYVFHHLITLPRAAATSASEADMHAASIDGSADIAERVAGV